MSKRILLLTDSLTLPRLKPELCLHEETWPEILRAKGYHVHQVSIGGATSGDLARQCHYHKAFNADVVIVQVGIVDCAPRFLTKFELSIFHKIPFFGRVGIQALNRPIIKRIRKISYVNPELFFRNLQSIQRSFDPVDVYFLGIVRGSQAYEKAAPGIINNIKKYNEIIKANFNYLSLESIDVSCIMSDFHHLNPKGQKMIGDIVLSKLR